MTVIVLLKSTVKPPFLTYFPGRDIGLREVRFALQLRQSIVLNYILKIFTS